MLVKFLALPVIVYYRRTFLDIFTSLDWTRLTDLGRWFDERRSNGFESARSQIIARVAAAPLRSRSIVVDAGCVGFQSTWALSLFRAGSTTLWTHALMSEMWHIGRSTCNFYLLRLRSSGMDL